MGKILASLLVILLGSMFLGAPAPFTMRVVDDQTGAAVPGLRVTTDNRIVCYTAEATGTFDPAGSMANPLAGLEVQFTDGDRLHVHIVTNLLQQRIDSHATGTSNADFARTRHFKTG